MAIEDEMLQENAEKAEAPFEKRVAGSMAVLAALLAVVSVAGHIATTEEIVNQQRASDQWSYYQAKSIRRYESEIARDLLKSASSEKSADYQQNAERYRHDSDEIEKQAKELEQESALKGRQAFRLEMAEVFLEVAIVLASIAILTKRTMFWFGSLGGGVFGVVIAVGSQFLK